MSDRVFLDTNTWVYLYSDDPKAKEAEQLIDEQFELICVSTQVLNELFNVLAIKLKVKSKEDTKGIISDIINNFHIQIVSETTILLAIDIAIKYQYRYFDALMLASALECNCNLFYSEDMQDGQIIEEKMKLVNPF